MENSIATTIIQTSLAFLATLCATIPSVIALIFTARQLRESRRQSRQLDQSIKTSLYNEIVGSEREIWLDMLANDPNLCKWWLKNEWGFHDVQNKQKNKERLFILLRLGFYENLFYQNKIGTLAPQAWKVWQGEMKATMKNPSYSDVWKTVGHWYMEEFQQFVINNDPR